MPDVKDAPADSAKLGGTTEGRAVTSNRETNETSVSVVIDLDGSGRSNIVTSCGFLTHMLQQFAHYSMIDVELSASGDEAVDMHHQTEDIAIVLGAAIAEALGNKQGIRRYGTFYAPMDEVLVRSCIDLSGRPVCCLKVDFTREYIGDLETEMISHFFKTFAVSIGCSLHLECFYGSNNHHIAEGCFKALASALRVAIELDPRRSGLQASLPSTKGVL